MDYINLYTNFLRRFLSIRRPLKVVFDCSNGTTGSILENLFKDNPLVNFVLINRKPDGHFPAHGPDPLVPGAMDELLRVTVEKKADLGAIFDADGDRVVFADDLGRALDADSAAYILMRSFRPPYVFDVSTGWLPKQSASNFAESRVGHTFIKREMAKIGAEFGAERSGHYYFKDFFYGDSGILAAICMMNFVSNGKLSETMDELPKFYRMPETNFEAGDEKEKNKIMQKILDAYKDGAAKISEIDGLSMEFENGRGRFWFNLRPSNTEPKLRLNMEGRDKAALAKEFARIQKLLSSSEV